MVGYFDKRSGGFAYGFSALAIALLIAAGMAFLLHPAETRATVEPSPAADVP